MTLNNDVKEQMKNFFSHPQANRFVVMSADKELTSADDKLSGPYQGKQAKSMFLGAIAMTDADWSPVPKAYSDEASYLTVSVTPAGSDLAPSLEKITDMAAYSGVSGIRGHRVVAGAYKSEHYGVMLLLSRDIWYNERRVTRGFPDNSPNAIRIVLEDLADRLRKHRVPVDSVSAGSVSVPVNGTAQEDHSDDEVQSGMIDSALGELRQAVMEIERVLTPVRDKVANSPHTAAGLNALAEGMRSFSGRLVEIAGKIERK